MVNFPTSLDAWSNPTSATYMDDSGFELDVLISRIQDAIELIEAKVGITSSVAAANTVLAGNSAGATTFRQVATGDIAAGAITQRAQSGIFSGTRTAASYADVDSTNGKVTLTTTGGDLLALWAGYASNSSASIAQHVALRLDSGSDVGAIPAYSFPSAATFPIPFCVVYLFTGVSAGSHSVYGRHINDGASGTMTTAGTIVLIELKK